MNESMSSNEGALKIKFNTHAWEQERERSQGDALKPRHFV